jgi:hypothetical protein
LIGRVGFQAAFAVAAGLAALSLPAFVFLERRFGHAEPTRADDADEQSARVAITSE